MWNPILEWKLHTREQQRQKLWEIPQKIIPQVSYKIFEVNEKGFNEIEVGASYAGGTCIDGIYDEDEDQFLLIIKYIIGDSYVNPIV
tara:strand:+ start:1140 stop:1400 length:261 start_codon:yes stop_codon:yes gene_type:complete